MTPWSDLIAVCPIARVVAAGQVPKARYGMLCLQIERYLLEFIPDNLCCCGNWDMSSLGCIDRNFIFSTSVRKVSAFSAPEMKKGLLCAWYILFRYTGFLGRLRSMQAGLGRSTPQSADLFWTAISTLCVDFVLRALIRVAL